MPLKFRLQFLGNATDRAAIILEESEVRATDVSAAVQEIADVVWPTRAKGLRLIDVDGRVVYERLRADIERASLRRS